MCKDEGFYPHPGNCKKYYWCLSSGDSGFVSHEFTCPSGTLDLCYFYFTYEFFFSGLYFNKAADSCDFPQNVLCNKKLSSTKKSDTTTTTTEKTISTTTKLLRRITTPVTKPTASTDIDEYVR